MKLFYRQLGEQGDPIIILHGLFGHGDNWLTHAKALSANYKVFVLDLRNHGQSPHSSDWNYKVMSDDLVEFIEDHQLNKSILLGHSMGGKALMKFIESHQYLAKKFIIIDISPRYYEPHHHQVLQALQAVDFNKINSRKQAEEILLPYLPDFGTRQFLLKNIYWKENGKMDWRFNFEVIRDKIEMIGEACMVNSHCDLPTLFIRGELSCYINENDLKEILNKFSRVEVIPIPGAGHWVHADKPKEFLDVILKFIEK